MSRLKDLIAKMREPQSPNLAALLGQYYSVRNTGAYSGKAKVGNLKCYSEDVSFLQSKGLYSVEQLNDYVSELSGRLYDMNAASRKKSDRMKELKELLRLAYDYTSLMPIFDGIPSKGGFWKKREKHMVEHDSEINPFQAVKRRLDSLLPDKKFATKAWKSELDRLVNEYAAMGNEISAINAVLKKSRYPADPYYRNANTVVHVLEHMECTDCTVNFKTYTNSIWDKKQRDNPEEN